MLNLAGFLFAVLVGQIQVKDGKPVEVTVIKRIEIKQEYYLLTREKPVEVEVSGPSTLRFYTRLVFTDPSRKSGRYSIILEEDSVRQKAVVKSTEMSKGAKWNGYRLGKWRSFIVEVPPGRHVYRLYLFDATFDSVLVRPVIEKSYKWKEVTPSTPAEAIIAVENNNPVRYWASDSGKLGFPVDGPARVKIAVRYNFAPRDPEPEDVLVRAYIDGKLVSEKSFTVLKSHSVYYQDNPILIPSVRKVVWLNVPKGKHVLKVELTPPNTSVRVLVGRK